MRSNYTYLALTHNQNFQEFKENTQERQDNFIAARLKNVTHLHDAQWVWLHFGSEMKSM